MNTQDDSLIPEWFRIAEEDELTLRSILKHRDAPPSMACFHAQQMAEKLLKVLLVAYKKENPKIHDLKRLATILESSVSNIFDLDESLTFLNKFYITTRYPGDFPEGFSWKDAEQALNASVQIKEFVIKQLEK